MTLPVTLVTVNYRSSALVAELLGSVRADPDGPDQVIVVDNTPHDPELEGSLDWLDDVDVIRLDENRGLAAGVNAATSRANHPLLAIINPDVVVTPGWLRPLAETVSRRGVGAACPLIVMAGTHRVNSFGQHLHVTGFGFNRHQGSPVGRIRNEPEPVAGLHGAAFVIRREALDAIGGWNETGFLYHEDVALSWDLRLAGYSIVAVPSSRVEHRYRLSMSPDKLFLLERNRRLLISSHLRRQTRLLLAPLLGAAAGAVWSMAAVRGPAYREALGRARRWASEHPEADAQWGADVARFRTISDWALLSRLSWSFPLSQVGRLLAERRPNRPPPDGFLDE